MKRRITSVNYFWVKLLAIVLAVFLAFIIPVFAFFYLYFEKLFLQQAVTHLRFSAATAASFVDVESHRRILREKNPASDVYLAEEEKLRKVLVSSPRLRYIYTMSRNARGEIIFVVDPTAPGDADHDGVEDKSYIGELYVEAPKALKQAFSGEMMISAPYHDKWGDFISAYVPILDAWGDVDFVVGADYTISHVEETVREMLRRTAAYFLPLLLGVILLPFLISFITTRRLASLSRQLTGVVTSDLPDVDLEYGRTEVEFIPFFESVSEIIGKQHKTEQGLRESERRYRLLADNISDIIWTIDPQMHFMYVSPSVTSQLGLRAADLLQRSIEVLLPKSSLEKATAMIGALLGGDGGEEDAGADARRGHGIVLEHYRSDSSTAWFEVIAAPLLDAEGKPAGVICSSRNVTERLQAEHEREQMQKQLIRAQKMETVGSLASGLAHDFNNIMGGLVGALSIIRHKLDKKGALELGEVNEYFCIMESSSQRAIDMVQQLLTLARKREISLAPVDLNLIMRYVQKLCESTFDKSIEIDMRTLPDPAMVMADPAQIEQVLLNLCVNASHAMTIMRGEGEHQGGALVVSIERMPSDRFFRLTFPEADPKTDYWKLSVADTGVGIDQGTVTKIFDPFFTTKEKGKGTGLGLSIAYNIVKQHNGFINVYSKPGSGSTFDIYLPILLDHAGVEQAAGVEELPVGEGLILVVEDENIMRQVAKSILEMVGYRVLLAENGEKGVELFRERHREIAAVLMDLMMPKKSGLEAFAEIMEIDPAAKVIVASGLRQDERVQQILDRGGKGFVQKPYTLVRLAQAIHAVVTEKAGS